jgi:hypothetical protein
MLVTIVGHAGPLSVGYVPGKVWVCGAFLTPEDAREHGRLTVQAALLADEEAEHPAEPGKSL